MGTRCDFYVGRGPQAEWLGSYPYDGYPDGIPVAVKAAITEPEFRAAVTAYLTEPEHAGRSTLPEMGWPWPWDDSGLTDYSYAFDGDKVHVLSGYPDKRWIPVLDYEQRRHADGIARDKDGADEDAIGRAFDAWRDTFPRADLPNMKARKNVTLGPRSGVMVFRVP